MRLDVMRVTAMIAACGRALRLGADRLKKFLDTTGRSLDLNSNQSLPSAVRCAIASAASPRSRPSPCCCEGGRVENAPTWRRQVQNRYSSTMRACKLLIVRELGWRRGWDSNPITSCRFCSLQTPRCRGCHTCQRCRGALHPIAPRVLHPDERIHEGEAYGGIALGCPQGRRARDA